MMQSDDQLARSMSFRVSSTGVANKSSLDIVGNDKRQLSDLLDP